MKFWMLDYGGLDAWEVGEENRCSGSSNEGTYDEDACMLARRS